MFALVTRPARSALAGLLLLVPGAAWAQNVTKSTAGEPPEPPSAPRFAGQVGLGVAALPRYVGSDEYRVLPFPLVQLEYRGRLFVGGSPSSVGAGVGVHLLRAGGLAWDVGLSGSETRPERRGRALAGMGTRGAATYATTSVAYRLGEVTATAAASFGLERGQGRSGSAALAAEHAFGRRWLGGVTAGATVADADNMAFDFGVTPAQSAARRALAAAGDPRMRGLDARAYVPRRGLKQVQGGAMLAYALTGRTRALLFAQGTRLAADAARSPIVRTRDAAAAGAGLAYGF
jgi:outer membrane protein